MVLENAEVYLDDFIVVVQGWPMEHTQMTLHLFLYIYELFQPQNSQYRSLEEHIHLNKLDKGGVRWSTTNTVLGWVVNTINLVLTLPQAQTDKLSSDLESSPQSAKLISNWKWFYC